MYWIKSTLLKTVKTMAQSAIGVIGGSLTLGEVNWIVVGSSVLLAGISCILFNIANLEVDNAQSKELGIKGDDDYGL